MDRARSSQRPDKPEDLRKDSRTSSALPGSVDFPSPSNSFPHSPFSISLEKKSKKRAKKREARWTALLSAPLPRESLDEMSRADFDVDIAGDILTSRMETILHTITSSLRGSRDPVSAPVRSIRAFSSPPKASERAVEIGKRSTADLEEKDLELGGQQPCSQSLELNQQVEEYPGVLRVLKVLVPAGIRLLGPAPLDGGEVKREDLKYLIPHVILIATLVTRSIHCVQHCPKGPSIPEAALLRAFFGLFSHYHLLAWLKKLKVAKDALDYASQHSIVSVWIKRALWKSAPVGLFLLGSWVADLCSLPLYIYSYEDIGWKTSSVVLLKAMLALLLTYQWLCIGFTLLGLNAVMEFGASAPQVLIKLACEDKFSDEHRESVESGGGRESGTEREVRKRTTWKLIYLEHQLMHSILRRLVLVIQNLAAGYISFVGLLGVFLITQVMLKPVGTFEGVDYFLLGEVYLTWFAFLQVVAKGEKGGDTEAGGTEKCSFPPPPAPLQVAHRLACVNAKLERLPRLLMESDLETFDSITRWVRLQNMMQENTGFHIRGWNMDHDKLLKIFMAFLSASFLILNRLTEGFGSQKRF